METKEECQHEQTRWLQDEEKSWAKGEIPIRVCCNCGEELVVECGQPIEEARPCCDGRSGVRGCFECSFAR